MSGEQSRYYVAPGFIPYVAPGFIRGFAGNSYEIRTLVQWVYLIPRINSGATYWNHLSGVHDYAACEFAGTIKLHFQDLKSSLYAPKVNEIGYYFLNLLN